jgi:hypothetical protein
MAESIMSTGTNVKFIEGMTLMTQANWQEYFASQFPNRIIDGFDTSSGSSSISVANGSAIVNGIYTKMEFENGRVIFAPIGYDAFICLRVYLNEEKVELVEKYNIAASNSSASIQTAMMKFMSDESYQCTRNDTIYEIPLHYSGTDYFASGIDLRRRGVLSENVQKDNPTTSTTVLSGRNKYYLGLPNTGADTLIPVYIDFINEAEDVDLYFYVSNSSSGATLAISQYPYTNISNDPLGYYMLMLVIRYDSTEWTLDSTNHYLKRVISSGLTHIKVKLLTSSVVDNTYPQKQYALFVM